MSKLPEQLQKQVNAAENFYTDADKSGEAESKPVNTLTNEITASDGGVAEDTSGATQEVRHPVEDENTETYAQRWRSQQGIVASLNQKLGYSEQRINQLETLISTMQQPAQAETKAESKQHLTDKDSEDYGEDMVDFVKRAVAEGTDTLRSENEALRRQLASLNGVVPTVQRLTQQHQVSREDAFWSSLSSAVSDWEQVNADANFRNWLVETDPMTGITRDVYLKDAQRELDVSRVANIFNSWKQQFTAVTKAGSTRATARNELEMQVAPGSRTGGDVPTQSETKKWSNVDIAKYYDDVRKGVFKGRPAEARAIEEDIFRARSQTA